MTQDNSKRPVCSSGHQPKPHWLKVRLPGGSTCNAVRAAVAKAHLHTVCEEARCPNLGECWGSGTATFLILGSQCTRSCRFCAVRTGNPTGEPDPEEPRRVAQAVEAMSLAFAVITSVTRDDLADGGAGHFAAVIRQIRRRCPEVRLEVLIPDFGGQQQSIERVVRLRPDVIAHNIETTEALTPLVRDKRCDYGRSLGLLRQVKRLWPDAVTKSSLMLGLGETREQIRQALRDLRTYHVDILTIGQYLQPTKKHLPVSRYVSIEEFDEWGRGAMDLGFAYVASGPLVRSSYRAAEAFRRADDVHEGRFGGSFRPGF